MNKRVVTHFFYEFSYIYAEIKNYIILLKILMKAGYHEIEEWEN